MASIEGTYYFVMRISASYLALLGSVFLSTISGAKAQDCILPIEQLPALRSGGSITDIVAAVQNRLVYPPQAKRDHLEGRVFVKCTVTTNGVVEGVYVVRGLRPDCDSAAVHAVRKLPRLVPSQQNGKPVACGLTIPVKFKVSALSGSGLK